MTAFLFRTPRIEHDEARLATMTRAAAHALGPLVAAIDPWARMGYPPRALTAYLDAPDAAAYKFAIEFKGALAGGITIRQPWLKGPYIEFLAVLPAFQGRGIGSALLDWLEREAAASERNLWVVASAFNEGAVAFYQRHGYRQVANLPDLVHDGFEEILLRKFPLVREAEKAAQK